MTYNLAYSYDQYGDMTCTVNGNTNGLCPAYSFNQANNRITNSGYTYDAAGELTSDGTHTYQYDAEGRFASEDGGATEVHTYNALGARARIVSQGTPLDLFSDPAGKPLGTNGSYSVLWPLPGHAGDIYYQGYDAEFFHANGLGSTVMESNASGTVSEHLMFYPWGQLWALAGGGGYNFASIPYRDVVSDLDLARFRDYSYGAGRWLSPDPANAGADPSNPQAWNAYSYAGNNPTTNTDPSGLYCVKDANGSLHDVGNEGESCADVRKSNAAEEKHPSVTVTGKPGNVAEAVAANFGIGITNLMTSNANTFSSMLTVGQYSPNFPHIPAGSGVAANIGAIAPLVGMAFIAPEGDAGDVLETELARPAWAKTPGGFVSWLREFFQNTRSQLTSEQADAVVEECKRLHIEIRLDPPQGDWNTPHFNVGGRGQVHLAVPPSYENPSLPRGRDW